MNSKSFNSELARALARPDVEELKRVLHCYYEWDRSSDEYPDEADVVMQAYHNDPDMGLAFVVLASSSYDDPQFLALVAAGVLENLLQNPTREIFERILNEARKFARFRWMLSIPYPHAVAQSIDGEVMHLDPAHIRNEIAKLVGTMRGDDPLPPRPAA